MALDDGHESYKKKTGTVYLVGLRTTGLDKGEMKYFTFGIGGSVLGRVMQKPMDAHMPLSYNDTGFEELHPDSELETSLGLGDLWQLHRCRRDWWHSFQHRYQDLNR